MDPYSIRHRPELPFLEDNDWRREAPKMADIYQNAALTIAASSSSDCHEGCCNTYSQSQELNVK